LSEGIVSGETVVCPLHAWKIRLETGMVARPVHELPCLETFRTQVQAGVILLEVPVELRAVEVQQAPGNQTRQSSP
jgi:nitrite reductase (NADH) small subunit